MASEIKTRIARKDIKAIDKAATIAQHMKHSSVQIKERAEQTQELYNLTAVCAMKTEDYAKALECFQAGIALAESKTGDDKTKADTALLQEMEYNVIVCYEQQADWENAKSAMKQYQEDFPEDDSVSKEAEFLQTR